MKNKCTVISISNQKGGFGKTTTALNLAIGLARDGYSVLAVDFDPQGDLTASLEWKDNDFLENTISTMLESSINDSPYRFSSGIVGNKRSDSLPRYNNGSSGALASLLTLQKERE